MSEISNSLHEIDKILNELKNIKKNPQSLKEETLFINIVKGIVIAVIAAGIVSSITLYERIGIVESKIEQISKLDDKICKLEVYMYTLKDQNTASIHEIENIKTKINSLQPKEREK